MGLDFKRDISYPESVGHWYDTVYLPVVEPIHDRGLLRWFPGRTETDMYLWVSEHRVSLENELGWAVSPQAAVEDLATRQNPQASSDVAATGNWRMTKMFDRYTDVLFSDILVPINGSTASWQALEQAILIARHEKASLHGLHVVPPNGRTDGPRALGVQERFNETCRQADASQYLKDVMAIVKGNIADQVCQRALLTDLIVLNVAHPPATGLSSLNSGLRSIIWRSARPILTVPGKVSPMDRALVAFDGGIKSREALFVAAYLGEVWKTSLTILTVSEGGKVSSSAQDYARSYLDLHELQADFVVTDGPVSAFPDIIKERDINLVLMGGYSGTALKEVILGSAVNFLLRKADCPLLICR
jgi:nucleotide-binding universal stress UspA family protein